MSRNQNRTTFTVEGNNIQPEDEDMNETKDGVATNELYTNDNLFSSLNFTAQGSADCYAPTKATALTCFNSNSECGGEILNGLCELCSAALRKLHIYVYNDINNSTCGKTKRLPFSTQAFTEETPIFPLLSMHGILTTEMLQPLKNCSRDGILNTHCTEYIHQLSLPRTGRDEQVVTDLTSRAIKFRQDHAPLMKTYINTNDSTTVRCWFTTGYQPTNKLSENIRNQATPVTDATGAVIAYVASVPISRFKNIVDMYNLRIYPSSAYKRGGNSVLKLPNIQIVDGWIHYGYGFGSNALSPIKSITSSQHNISPSSRFITNSSAVIVIPLTPLTMDGSQNSDYDNQLTVYPMSSAGTLTIPDLADISCNNTFQFLTARN
jgi:hypothetical protein